LFKLANNIVESHSEQTHKQAVMYLFAYTRKHFLSEENMMQSIGFPLLTEHKKIHDSLIEQLTKVSEAPMKSDEDRLHLKNFIYHWLTKHILTEDKKYYKFAKENNITSQ